MEEAKAAEAKAAKSAKPLEVSGAFHSPFMEPARPALAEALRGVEVRTPRVAVYSNVTGRPYEDAAQIRALLERRRVLARREWLPAAAGTPCPQRQAAAFALLLLLFSVTPAALPLSRAALFSHPTRARWEIS